MPRRTAASLLVGLAVFAALLVLSSGVVVWWAGFVHLPAVLAGFLLVPMTVICAGLGYRAGHPTTSAVNEARPAPAA